MNLTVNRDWRQRQHIWALRHPEWLGWFLSILGWLLIASYMPAMHHNTIHIPYAPVCGNVGNVDYLIPSKFQGLSLAGRLIQAICDGAIPWIIMVAAMMFPLLRDPIRHTAFSVRQKDSLTATLSFLAGYTLTWIFFGLAFISLPILLEGLFESQLPVVRNAIKASGFLIAAALVLLPYRPILMNQCSLKMPIRIGGWQLYGDSFRYGAAMGLICLAICWAPMAALTLAGHNLMLMGVATMVVYAERYLVRHTSKLPAYAWLTIAIGLLAPTLWA